MWVFPDSQEVGLEAAILERVRNSSLVESTCADNPTGLKPGAEATGLVLGLIGRGASQSAVKVSCEGSWSGWE